MTVSLILTCAGTGERVGFGYNKLLADMGGITPFEKSLSAFVSSDLINQYIIVCRNEDKNAFERTTKSLGICAEFVQGGATRHKSVSSGLNIATGDITIIHDGARPFVSQEIIADCINNAMIYGSGISAVPCTDTIATIDDGFIISSSKSDKYSVQTPQAFLTSELKRAFSLASDDEDFSDESGLYSRYVGKCKISLGSNDNKKLTFASDFSHTGNCFCGTGFDLHIFSPNRKLILGGVEIPYEKGLLGHSDADVLIHAIMDALLSSAGLRDIGFYFPDTDPKYEGISSIILLEKVMELLKTEGYKPINITSVIMAQKPKLSPYVEKIRKNIADVLGVDVKSVGITCTTLEGIGIVGREEGIAVQAYCLTQKFAK